MDVPASFSCHLNLLLGETLTNQRSGLGLDCVTSDLEKGDLSKYIYNIRFSGPVYLLNVDVGK